ncbi:outer membrane protein [Marinobacter sp. LV10R520-4]|uniref:TIGR04219 family outer membrane beta-barrel protein n=1 Tax=Marinobacter sp. LV10R520-4 TaxID=1761796 RepID=UPI000BF493D5|nr:TIGR04219 family outer membrane beta-barrel protein [Marinobacter sp. LV10R520-4]PFG54865.1 outer membrane protein [Marinobacter sp. LV10R520-4]
MRKLLMVMAGSAVLAAPMVQADILGLGAQVGYWDSELSGDVATNGGSVDVNDELNLDGESSNQLSLYLEHPIPLLPNVRVAYINIDQTASGRLNNDFDNVDAGLVRSDLELEQLDLTLYYEVLDNWVNLDLGLTVRDFSGELIVQNGIDPISRTTADAVLPMGYLAARFDLPFSGVSVGIEGNAIAYSGDSLHDFNVYGQYQLSLLQLRAGYRQMAVDYEDGDDRFDVEIDGPFISAGVVF